MTTYKIFFGHPNSVGVEVEAASEKQAKIKAMDVLREHRGDTKWSASQYVGWEEKLGNVIYEYDPEFHGMKLSNEDGEAVYAGPPRHRDCGVFPPIVKVQLLG